MYRARAKHLDARLGMHRTRVETGKPGFGHSRVRLFPGSIDLIHSLAQMLTLCIHIFDVKIIIIQSQHILGMKKTIQKNVIV